MKVRLVSHLLLPRRTAPEGDGALRGGDATVKRVRRNKSPFLWPVTSIIRHPWAPPSAMARVAAVKRLPGVMGDAAGGAMSCWALAARAAAVVDGESQSAAWPAAGHPIGE